jgi:probable F420-dependent oxidoreductase
MSRPIRFGHQGRPECHDDAGDVARRAEAVGFDTFLLADHVGGGPSPMIGLTAAAMATERIRLGTFVLNSDMRNPVQLAWEAATVDHVSGGRFELGLGAGHTPQEYVATGIELCPPSARKSALADRVDIIRRLLDGETVDAHGSAHRVRGATVPSPVQERLPILVGGNGEKLLARVGATADIVGLQGLGRTLEDGHRHTVNWSTAHLDRQIDQVRAGAAERMHELEFNALVQVVEITDDGERSLDELAERLGGAMSVDELVEIPYALIGTVDEIVAKILRCRDRWGISYFAVRELDAFGDVIDEIRRLDRPTTAAHR